MLWNNEVCVRTKNISLYIFISSSLSSHTHKEGKKQLLKLAFIRGNSIQNRFKKHVMWASYLRTYENNFNSFDDCLEIIKWMEIRKKNTNSYHN